MLGVPATEARLPDDAALPSLPSRLQVEVTNRCHLGCESCARHHWEPAVNPVGDIGPATLDQLQPLLEAATEVTLGGYGDPTEAPDALVETVRRAKAAGSSVRLITGGAKLNAPLLDRLADAGLDRLVLSMDGATDATLRQLRGVSLRAYLGWIRAARALADARGGVRPLVQLNVVAQWANIAELPALVDLCADEGVAGLHVFHLKAYTPDTFDRCLLTEPEKARPYFVEARRRAMCRGVFLALPTLDPSVQVCTQPFEHLFVRHDGSVRGCCSGLFEPAVHGLLAGALPGTPAAARMPDGTPEELWRAPILQQYRAAARAGDDVRLPTPCRTCAFRLPTLAAHRRPLRVVS
ncbi:MAG: radical SAM protein [Deltaproteobacteria bacterium]|nr:radical SAM protein [Deltaproteobacteria bacterium]